MILADTSVWIDHFRKNDPDMAGRLDAGEILIHPFVIGELTLGGLKRGGVEDADLRLLPNVAIARHDEVLTMLAEHRIVGSGIGWVDAHLLCAVMLSAEARLWTRDRKLGVVAGRLGVGY